MSARVVYVAEVWQGRKRVGMFVHTDRANLTERAEILADTIWATQRKPAEVRISPADWFGDRSVIPAAPSPSAKGEKHE